VGTQRTDGQYLASGHQTAEFAFAPTWQGVAVAPSSDRVMLQTEPAGFLLKSADPAGLAMLWPDQPAAQQAAGRAMTRFLDLPDLPASQLQTRLGEALADAATAPKPARFFPRLRVAAAMLAQGMDLEAQGALQTALADDPAHGNDRTLKGLSAAASWLSAAAGGQGPPKLDFDPALLGSSDEALLWRTLLQPDRPTIAAAAATMASVWPVLQVYSESLRRLILPAAADILANGGQEAALTALLAAFPDPSLDLARAAQLRRQGRIDASLALFDRIAAGNDRLMRAKALEQAVETRLAAHRMTAENAAEALSRQFYAWRDGARELRLRLRVAQLQTQAGAWRRALAMLQETEAAFPADHAAIHDAETAVMAALLHGDNAARLSPLDLVELADQATRLLGTPDADPALAPILVDKLLALDLPSRAEPLLRRLFTQAAPGPRKSDLGLRLAGLLADRNDWSGALDVLNNTDPAGSDAALASRYGLLKARILANLGQTDAALALLSDLPGIQPATQRAGLLEGRHAWAAAAGVLDDLRRSPGFASLPDADQREALLRLARDESEAGDMAALRRLRDTEAGRFAHGPGADLFAVLTAEPVQAVSDLPRSGEELARMRALPASLSVKDAPR
jgi:predicted negative regulator of RcsB-dependent stress response